MSSYNLRPKTNPTQERECLFCETVFVCPLNCDDSFCIDCGPHTGICLTCDAYTVLRDKQCTDCLAETGVDLEPDDYERIQTIVIHPDSVEVVLPNPIVAPPTPPRKRTYEGMTGSPTPTPLRPSKPPCPGLFRANPSVKPRTLADLIDMRAMTSGYACIGGFTMTREGIRFVVDLTLE